jgi:hypothetical protein
MAASDLLKATIRRFRLNPADEQAVFNFFDGKLSDPSFETNETVIRYYVEQDPTITEIFDRRFAGNKALREAGKPEYSYSNYIALENEMRDDLRDAGFPPGFYDDTDSLSKLIGGEVSRQELRDRSSAAYTAVRQADPGTVAELRNLYGITQGELAAYYLDPQKAVDAIGQRLTGQDLIRRTQAAQISAQARQQANMGLTAQQAEQLAAQGVNQETARQGFGQLQLDQGLYQAQMRGEEVIGQEEQIAAAFGTSAAAAQRVATRRRRRQAEFEAGGQLAAGQTGVQGLRTAGQ